MEINIAERIALANKYFAEGYNCSQSVALTYADICQIDPQLMAKISAPFGGGIGRLREVCGTVSGMSIVAGFISPADDPTDKVAKGENYKLVQNFAKQFRHENGSIICRELLGMTPCATTPAKRRSCGELVEMAARIVGEYLQAH